MESGLLRELLDIGLTEGEAKVYLALTELGSSTIGPIVEKAKVASSNIYEILGRLQEKGIASYIIKSKVKYFQAASPKALWGYLERKEEDIREQKRTLSRITNDLEKIQEVTPRQEAEVFVGWKGLKTAFGRHLGRSEKGKENIFFYIHKEKYAKEADLFYFSIIDLYAKIPSRGITNAYGRKSPWFKKAKVKTRFADFPIPGNIEVRGDSVIIVSWEPQLLAILIHSKNIADNLREYFEEAWKHSKRG
ncbi:MAG TPA: helix-turn-helix domain-containing protein [Candidatus Nanoarchaeia archaeon]|nr:helix-turn-helix domain-containing protein [Candidatus Nanoarchaeia archaeon]